MGRILAGVLMVILIAWGYWWMPLVAGIIFLFVFNSYYEIILWGVIFDALYTVIPQNGYDYRVHLGAFISLVLYFSGIFLKKRLAFYS